MRLFPQTVLSLGLLCLVPQILQAESSTPSGATLPGTSQLDYQAPLHEVMVRGISQFAEQELAAARGFRQPRWNSAADPQEARVEARERLRKLIGAVDPLVAEPVIWSSVREGDDRLLEAESQEHKYLVVQSLLAWQVMEGVTGEAYAINPLVIGANEQELSLGQQPVIILLADPDDLRQHGLQQAQRMASLGAFVLAPVLIDRQTQFSAHPDIRRTNLTHREYIYRLGFNLGRHIIGYEVQRVLALVQALPEFGAGDVPLILVGVGEGAVVAQYVAALAPEKFSAVVLHGTFGPPEQVWQQPIYRNIWNQLSEFGPAELASLIAPTPLIIEAGRLSTIVGPPEPQAGQAKIAAPGTINSPALPAVQREFERAQGYDQQGGLQGRLQLISHPDSPFSRQTQELLNAQLKLGFEPLPGDLKFESDDTSVETDRWNAQQQRLVSELVRHTQMLLARCDKVRGQLWKEVDRSSPVAWERQVDQYRELVYGSFIGKLDIDQADPRPQSRKIIDEVDHVGYEVVLDVIPVEQPSEATPGVIAGGILLLPKDLKPGERRPVVVCQHGLEGTPMDTITLDKSLRAFNAYQGYSTELVRRGFIVYAPQNPYKGYDDFRVLQRKSNPIGRSLFSYIIPQHQQTLNWLAELPYVDPERIAFYGLSYGGKTAVRVPPLLPGSEGQAGYCLSICSADFNEWIRKNASAEDRYSYVYTPEYEIFEWDMGHVANYAELAWLMGTRPFMVERGLDDGVAPDEWVGWEFAKVQRHYMKLGLADRAEIEWFNGPHAIHGVGTYRFLHHHLNWPAPQE